MTVSCSECRSVFRVDPAKVPATGVRARCSVCGGVIAIAGGTLPVSVTPVASSMAVPAFGAGVSRATPVAAGASLPPAVARATPVSAPAAVAGALSGAPSGAAAVPAATPAPSSLPPSMATPAAAVPRVVPAPSTRPTPAAASLAMPPVATGTAALQVNGTPARGTPVATPAAAPVSTLPTPMATPVAAPAAAPGSVGTVAGTAAGTAAGTVAGTVAGSPQAPAAARKPINPFLRADPSQRARRLARALVSDLVAYHPQKREEGLRDGTLRQLFREEIKKSYEEYVEQVGRDVAESAPHFQEALNEILAGGRRLF